ncbi:family 43 glycosylhydrolase [Agromyces aurantiacus]|uniref:Family 43 glycosylhydrolase n=1 Tax=Agromyces aurantiacus TaxID=165814 RepID=A0ABV9R562_9MICO|nr:family 43 glycosylhydrolase [Agromyces aurantiacus]MBM7503941.1 alpha-N-arabinofuranosidase [Agromyces aurantiacus]
MGRYRNPILPGCHPDPSICRWGDEFVLVTSTFEMLPGLPVHRSRDLVHWELAGHAVHRPGQLDLSSVPASGGLFAPTVRAHGGRLHVVCTVVGGNGRRGHFLVTASDPAGPWSDPVWFDGIEGIDPSLVFHDGRVWLHGTRLADPGDWPEQTEVWLRELDAATWAPIGDEHVLWRGALLGARWAEGPHLFHRAGRWLLLAAEGGTERDHAIVVAYADEITGPYAGDPGNPRLTHRDLGSRAELVDVGHADLVDDDDGRTWAVLLATRLVEGRRSLLARQTCLVPVEWEDGRPVFAPGVGRVALEVESEGVPEIATPPADGVSLGAAVQGSGTEWLDPEWNAVRRLPEEVVEFDGDGAVLLAGGCPPDRVGGLGFLGARLPGLRSLVRMRFSIERAHAGFAAGLMLRHSEAAHLTLLVEDGADARRIVTTVRSADGATRAIETAAPGDGGVVELRIEVDGFTATGTARVGDAPEIAIGTAEVWALGPDAAGGFLGVWAGALAVGDGVIRIDELEVRPLD